MALLKRFTAVIIEDSSRISLPNELAEVWRGCGGSPGSSQATLKLFVRWNVLSGELRGRCSPMGDRPMPRVPSKSRKCHGGLYLGDQGFFEQGRLRQWHQRQGGQRRYYRRWGLGSTREAGIASCCRNRREPAWNWACWSAARRGCPHA